MRILTVDVHIDGLVRFETFRETKAVFTLDAWVQRPSAILVGHRQ